MTLATRGDVITPDQVLGVDLGIKNFLNFSDDTPNFVISDKTWDNKVLLKDAFYKAIQIITNHPKKVIGFEEGIKTLKRGGFNSIKKFAVIDMFIEQLLMINKKNSASS